MAEEKMKKAYTVKYRRKREGKTDYRSRIKLLSSHKNRIVVRRSLHNLTIQFVSLDKKGDKILIASSTKELLSYGWSAHRGNLPSAYLAGYLCGLKAKKKNTIEGILDIGLSRAVKGSGFFSAVKGLIDAGINIKCSEEFLPSLDAVTGKTIANYAIHLSKDKDKYLRQFSSYQKIGLKPEELPKKFEEAKKKITEKWH